MKTCKECKVKKDLNLFGKAINNKDGKNIRCKDCMKIRNKRYNNPLYYQTHKEEFKKYQERFKKKNPDYIKKYMDIYQKTDKGKEVQSKSTKKWLNTDSGKKIVKGYYLKNKVRINESARIRNKKRYNTDEMYKFKVDTRNRINMFYKSKGTYKNGSRTEKIIGCSWKNNWNWIQFNRNIDCLDDFQTDHLIPLCSAKDKIEMIKLCNWTNTIPTSIQYNLEKHDRLPTKHELFKQELRLYLFNRLKY